MPSPKSPLSAAQIIRYLRSGKSPKEIAYLIGYTDWGVWKYIERHLEVRAVYVETYGLRYPGKTDPPRKIRIPLQEAVQ